VKPEQTLLNAALRKEILAKIEACYKIAEKHYERKIPRPSEVRFDLKGRTGGLACYGPNSLRFHLIFCVENKKDYIGQVVPHECAHLINRHVNKPGDGKKRMMPHGKEWKAVMGVLGVPAKVTHNYDCTSIQTNRRRKITFKGSRVLRFLTQIEKFTRRLTDEERHEFYNELHSLA
jgi:predicted SprT family Zn-dependent metalloprotease